MHPSYLIMIIVISGTESQVAHLNLPCGRYVVYFNAPTTTAWKGSIVIPTTHELHGAWIKFRFNDSVDVLSTTFALPRTSDNREYFLEAPSQHFPPNAVSLVPVLVRYSSPFAPIVEHLRVNGKLICPRKRKGE